MFAKTERFGEGPRVMVVLMLLLAARKKCFFFLVTVGRTRFLCFRSGHLVVHPSSRRATALDH